jgi:sulfonate transport system permease protein
MSAIAQKLGRHFDYRGWAGFLLILAIWEILAIADRNSALAIASIQGTLRSGAELFRTGDLWLNYEASLGRVVSGVATGGGIGFAVGALLATSRWADRLIGPVITALRQVPMFGWVPLIGLWFGMGEPAKTVLISLSAFYPMALNTHEGLRGVPASYREVATVFRLNRWQALRRVLVPCALPSIMTGLKQALSFAWIAVVGAEMFMSAAPGIGAMLVTARVQLRMDVLFLGMAVIGGTGYAMNHGMTLLERRLLRWRQEFH